MENTTTFAPPLSGEVLAHVIEAFGLRHWDTRGVLSSSNAGRFLRGEGIGPEGEKLIWQATATALVAADLFPETLSLVSVIAVVEPVPEELAALPPDVVLARALTSLGNHWDETAGAVRRLTAPVGFPRHAAGACLRLVVIDLCVRLTGLLWLTEPRRENQLPRHWAAPNGVSKWLNQLRIQCSPPLTRDALAEAVDVSENTVDRWLGDEVRPSDDHLKHIAELLSQRRAGEGRELLRQLRLNYSLQALFKVIQGAIGDEQAGELASRIVAIPVLMLEVPRRSQKRSECDLKMRLAMIFGTLGRGELALPQIEAMLKPVWRFEDDPVWKTSIKAATRSWFEHLQYITMKLGPPATDAEWAAAGMPSPSPDDLEQLAYHVQASKEELVAQDPAWAKVFASEVAEGGKLGALELKMQAMDRASAHDFKEAVRLLRRAAEQDPLSAEIHFRLGACLWQSGDIPGGLAELEIAVRLDPGWDRPPVEIANVLLNLCRDEDALHRLEAASPHLRKPSTWHLLHLGFVHELLGNLDRAGEVYDELVRLDATHGEALDRLAHVRFLQGHKRQGADLAKRAAHVGFTDVFDAWKGRFYDRKRSGRPPRATPPEHLRQLRVSPRMLVRSPPSRGESPHVAQFPQVGRNEPCPCGSGKKFKKCHGNN